MFKTIVHTILALFLLVATTGVTISMHYCEGNLVSSTINEQAKGCCDDGGCCENKTIHCVIENDYVSPAVLENISAPTLDVLFPIVFILDIDLSPIQTESALAFVDTSPPPKIQTRLSLLQTYLI